MVAHCFQKRDCRRLSSFRNIRISFSTLKLPHDCASEACIDSLGHCQCSGGSGLEWQESFENVSIAECLGDARDIEHVTWLKRGSSIVNLLRDDFAPGSQGQLRFHVTTADLDRAATLLAQIDAETDVGGWGTLNKQFHMTLYGACQNERLIGLIATHHDAADRYVRLLLSNLDYEQQSQEEHRALLEACRDRNVDAASAVLQHHLLEGSRRFNAAAQSSSVSLR